MKPTRTFAEFIGHSRIVRYIRMLLIGTLDEGKIFPGFLLSGLSGVGKTFLAECIASLLGGNFFILRCGPDFNFKASLVPILKIIKSGDVLFIDEAHAFIRRLFEQLYRILDGQDITLSELLGGKKLPAAEELVIPRFTLVLATNEPEKLPRALCNRLEQIFIPLYSHEELASIIIEYFDKIEIPCTHQVANKLAVISKGIARNAIRHTDNVIRQTKSMGRTAVTTEEFRLYIDAAGINESSGLDHTDIEYLKVLKESGKPVGIDTIACRLHMCKAQLIRDAEPYLLSQGFVDIEKHGRILTPTGKQCINKILFESESSIGGIEVFTEAPGRRESEPCE